MECGNIQKVPSETRSEERRVGKERRTRRVLKLSKNKMVRSILFPAAVPEIFTGLRLGLSLTLIGTVLGEMFAAQHGLGYLLMNAIGLFFFFKKKTAYELST